MGHTYYRLGLTEVYLCVAGVGRGAFMLTKRIATHTFCLYHDLFIMRILNQLNQLDGIRHSKYFARNRLHVSMLYHCNVQ